MLEVIKTNGLALQFFPEKMKNNPEFIKEAVKQNGAILQNLDKILEIIKILFWKQLKIVVGLWNMRQTNLEMMLKSLEKQLKIVSLLLKLLLKK